jgi:hypothetical protein
MKPEKLTGEILGAAMAALKELKPGLDEKLYGNVLIVNGKVISDPKAVGTFSENHMAQSLGRKPRITQPGGAGTKTGQ